MLRELILGIPYFEKKNLIEQTEFKDEETLKQIQEKLLARALRLALTNIPFYRENPTLVQMDPTLPAMGQLKQFPIIDKEIIRKNLESMTAGKSIRKMKGTTGGSTGLPISFYVDRFKTRQYEKAFIFDQWKRVGYRFGDKIFNLRGRRPEKGKFIEHDRFFNIYYASSFELNKRNLNSYVEAINNIKPLFLHGYPSTIYQLASLIKDIGANFKFRFKSVFCGSEKLFPFQKERIEDIFGCRVYSWYGQSECLTLGGACEFSDKLHFYPQYGFTELIPTGMKTENGQEISEIVATGFNNPVMPMIRFRTGDYAVKSENQQCTCGRRYLLIDEVIGREQEFVVNAKKELISTTSLIYGQHFKAFEKIEAIQLYQDAPGKLKVRIVKGRNFSNSSVDDMVKKINGLLSHQMQVTIEYVSQIPDTDIGKARTVIQKLNIKDYF